MTPMMVRMVKPLSNCSAGSSRARYSSTSCHCVLRSRWRRLCLPFSFSAMA